MMRTQPANVLFSRLTTACGGQRFAPSLIPKAFDADEERY